MVKQLQKTGAPITYFGTDSATLLPAMKETGADVIGLAWRIPLDEGWARLDHQCAVHGNLDPLLLFADWKELKTRAEDILRRPCGRSGHTFNLDVCIVEAGRDSLITENAWASDLCRALGLGDQLIGSNDADRKTYILTNGRLVEMPDGLMFMVPTNIMPTVMSPLFSWTTKLRMLKELFLPKHYGPDESVASFVERHYGPEMVDRLADPLLSGVYGGEASNLSLRAGPIGKASCK